MGSHALCEYKGETLRAFLVTPGELQMWTAACQNSWEQVAQRLPSVLTPRAGDDGGVLRSEADDARVMATELDDLGRRLVRYADAVKRLAEASSPDLDTDGPRTALCCAREIGRLGEPPSQRLRHWNTDNKCSDEDAGVDFLERCWGPRSAATS